MVKHKSTPKSSSKIRRSSAYRLPAGSYIGGGWLPLTIKTAIGFDLTGNPGYVLSGEFSKISSNGEHEVSSRETDQWLDGPHVALANLNVDRAECAAMFIRRYGILDEADINDETGEFRIESSEFHHWQDFLRDAWKEEICFDGTIPVEIYVKADTILLNTRDLWSLIFFLFKRDNLAKKLGICGNPDCPAPYFRKSRTTQKFCEQGPCVNFAQRQYSLAWWNREGKKKREKARTRKGRTKDK